MAGWGPTVQVLPLLMVSSTVWVRSGLMVKPGALLHPGDHLAVLRAFVFHTPSSPHKTCLAAWSFFTGSTHFSDTLGKWACGLTWNPPVPREISSHTGCSLRLYHLSWHAIPQTAFLGKLLTSVYHGNTCLCFHGRRSSTKLPLEKAWVDESP